MSLQLVSQGRSHGGRQASYRHQSAATGTPMTFSLFLPPQAEAGPVPLVWFLSGLTCTPANVTDKGEFRAACAAHGLALVAPDTSPRGEGVADDPAGADDFGLGAGFYLDATEPPFAAHYRMRRYIVDELPALLAANFPLDMDRQSITGHSMGGHGALVIGLTNPGRFRAISAFAPICAPTQVPWGQKAFTGYLGPDEAGWRAHDAVALIADGARADALWVDQGEADPFLHNQLRPDLLADACAAAAIPLTLNRHPGYDHGYLFVSTFMAEQLAWHGARLNAEPLTPP